MSIAAEKVKQASERFLLVRLMPARYVLPTIVSGSTYQTSFSYPIAGIKRNGSDLNLVTVLASNDDYTYNESTGVVQMKLASAPTSTTNVIIIYYYLFYTGTTFRSISEDPEDSATTAREWQPRLSTYPVIGQSFDNMLNGVFSIQDTRIDIINEDGNFQAYLTDDDSFSNKRVDIWLCINSVSNILKVFTGTVTSMDMSQNSVSINATDSFNKLKQTAYMGDTADESIFRRSSSSFTALDPQHNDVPVPYIVGAASRFQTIAPTVAFATTPAIAAQRLSEATEAVCTNYNPNTTTSVNRQWGCCRQKSTTATQIWGTVEATTHPGSGVTFVRFSSFQNVSIGDTFKWRESGVDYYGLVVYAGTSFTYSAVSYNLIFSYNNNSFTTSSTMYALKSFAAYIDDSLAGNPFVELFYERDYSITEIATSGGNKYIQLNFVNNFEAAISSISFPTLDPSSHKVKFRSSNSTPESHGDIVKDILENVGIPINADSFIDADAALVTKCRFHIPNFDEDTHDIYLKYVQDILTSTQGYLKINSDFEVEYLLLTAPLTSDTRDQTLMLDQETRCTLEYRDIVTQIIGYNPHYDNYDAIVATATPSASSENKKAKYLHDIVNVNRFRHVLEDFSTVVVNHIGLQSSRAVKYSFATATEDIDTELGDDLTLDNKILLGNPTSTNLKVVSIEKSPGRISIEASDLKGI